MQLPQFLNPTALRATKTSAETNHRHSVHINTEVLSKSQDKNSTTHFKNNESESCFD